MPPFLVTLQAWAQAHPVLAVFCAVLVLAAVVEIRDFAVETVAMLVRAVRGQPVRQPRREKTDSAPFFSVRVTLAGGKPARRRPVPGRPGRPVCCPHRFGPVVSRLSGETIAARCRDCGQRLPVSEFPGAGEGRCVHARVAPVDVDGETVGWVCVNPGCAAALDPDWAVYAEDLPPEAEELQD